MKLISSSLFLLSILATSITYPALDPRQEIPLLDRQLILPPPPLPQDHPAFTTELPPQPPSVLPKLAVLAGGVWSWTKADTAPRSVCPKHNLPLHLSDTQNQNKACHEQHAHLPQNEQEAYQAQRLQDKQRGLPPLPHPDLSRKPVDLKAWLIPLQRDQYGAIQGLGGATELQKISPLSKKNIQQKYQPFLPEFNTKVQALITSAQESATTASPTVLHDTIAETLGPITHTIETNIASEQKGHIATMQTRLADLAWDRAQSGDFAGSLHAARTSIHIDQAVSETGLTLYTRSTDQLVQDVMALYRNHALAKATGIDTTHPEVAKKMIFGKQNERLYLAPYLQDKLNLSPRLNALIRGVEKGTYNFADGIKELASHPIATVEKIILSAAKIGAVIDHYIIGALTLDSRKDMPTILDAYAAAQNLSTEDIKRLVSSLTSPEGIERFSQITTELVLGILTGRAVGTIFGNTAASLEEMSSPLFLAGDSTVVIAEGAAPATSVAGQASAIMPVIQTLHKMDGDGQQHGGNQNQPQREHTVEPRVDKPTQQRVARIAQDSQEKYRQAQLRAQHGGKPNNNTVISPEQIYRDLAHELKILQDAEVKLAHVEGLEKVVTSFETAVASGDFASARGAAHELKTALTLFEKGESVVGINIRKEISGAIREFDIITTHGESTFYRECKNINWANVTEARISSMKGTFGQQQQIAQSNGATFVVHSKQPIPTSLKTWFDRQGILCIEG